MSITDKYLERIYKALNNMRGDARRDYYGAYEDIFIKYGNYSEELLVLVESLERELRDEL